MAKKKVAVVGSGVAGSGIAALLAHSGDYEVDLYEKNKLIGGRFASYDREGFRLDIGCHMIGSCDKGPMGEILKMMGQPDAVRWQYLETGASHFNYKGTDLLFPEEIHKLGFTDDEIQKILQFYAETLSIPEDQYDEYDKVNMLEQIEKYIRNDRARSFFGFISGLCFVTRDYETPVGEWARCNKQMRVKEAIGYPIGGTGAVPEAYVRIMEEHGGRMHLAMPIKRIIVEDKVAKGVELKDGTTQQYDIVISNAGLKPTVGLLIGRQHYSKEFLEKVDGYEYSLCAAALKVALDEPFIENKTMVLYFGTDDLYSREEEVEGGVIPEAMEILMVPILSNVDPSSCPEGRQLLIAGSGVGSRALDLSRADRKKWEQAFINGLEVPFPGISEHIMWTHYTSPGDVENLFGEDGNVIGIAQKLGQVGENRPPIEDPEIKNLYHCSADSGVHGIGGELAADSALRLFEMLR
jgi:prolycopene isomerase